jgi:hypothetical protein
MRISKNDVPVEVAAPGAVARLHPGFGDARVHQTAELLMFSPERAHRDVLAHMKAKLGG